MSTFGGALWGGSGSGSSSGSVGTPLSGLIMPAYRIAGLTKRAMIVPSQDMFDEAIPALNRLIASWQIQGAMIFTTSIASYPLTGAKTYSIGPGGDFDTVRPTYIKGANYLFPTTPVVRKELDILTDAEWQAVSLQDITGTPAQLYYHNGFDSSGQSDLCIRPQPSSGSLELYTWDQLQGSFTAKDDVAVFPPGYEQAIVYTLAEVLADLNPGMQSMLPAAHEAARKARAAVASKNSGEPPKRVPDVPGNRNGGGFNWMTGQ